jgi:hypothetical protein
MIGHKRTCEDSLSKEVIVQERHIIRFILYSIDVHR